MSKVSLSTPAEITKIIMPDADEILKLKKKKKKKINVFLSTYSFV